MVNFIQTAYFKKLKCLKILLKSNCIIQFSMIFDNWVCSVTEFVASLWNGGVANFLEDHVANMLCIDVPSFHLCLIFLVALLDCDVALEITNISDERD